MEIKEVKTRKGNKILLKQRNTAKSQDMNRTKKGFKPKLFKNNDHLWSTVLQEWKLPRASQKDQTGLWNSIWSGTKWYGVLRTQCMTPFASKTSSNEILYQMNKILF